MKNLIINNTEEDEKAVIKMIKESKGRKLLVAIHSLEEDDTPVNFVPKDKHECIAMTEMAKTVAAILEEVVEIKTDIRSIMKNNKTIAQLKLYSEIQNDLKNLLPTGCEGTILFPIDDR